MTNEELDKIYQLLSSPKTLELGFKLSETLGYSDVQLIEKLWDKFSCLLTIDNPLWCNVYFGLIIDDSILERGDHNRIRWRVFEINKGLVWNWNESKIVIVKKFIKYLRYERYRIR